MLLAFCITAIWTVVIGAGVVALLLTFWGDAALAVLFGKL
jgi:hypothetical protein